MEHWETLDVLEHNPEKVSGAWVFHGTRIPVAALFENLRDGATVEELSTSWPRNRAKVDEIVTRIDEIIPSDYVEIVV